MPSNFLQFDPALTNALSDVAYSANSTRTGGLSDGVAETALHNKLFCQTSTMVYALGQALSNAGETVADSNAANLVTSIESKIINPTAATVGQTITGTSTTLMVTPDALAGIWEKGSDIASGSTITVPSSGGGYFDITGTTTITAISESTTKTGRSITVQFNGVLTLTHNATSLILPTAANITTAAGDVARFVCINSGSNYWRCVSYQRASGRALVGAINAPYQSANQSISTAGTGTLTHGLGGYPTDISIWLECQTGEFNYTAGDRVCLGFYGTGSPADYGVGLTVTTTQIVYRYASLTAVFYYANKTTGANANFTNANWQMIVMAQRLT